MTHDPLCPAYEHAEDHYDDYWCSDRCKAPCQCDLIAKVRADEAQKTEERVTEHLYDSWDADLSHQRYH